MKTQLVIEDLTVRLGRNQVLTEVSLTVPEDSVTVLLGPNGTGKSTLLRTVLGLCRPAGGRVRFGDLDALRNSGEVRRRIGYVPDRPDVYPWMTLAELASFLRPHYPRWSDRRARELASELKAPWDVPFGRLSRGQATKGLLVAALAAEPGLLILDEPFGPLDPPAREDLLRGVLAGIASGGCPVLLATHDLHMAARVADRVVLLEDGCVRAEGDLADVLGVDAEGSQVPQRLRGLFDADSHERMVLR